MSEQQQPTSEAPTKLSLSHRLEQSLHEVDATMEMLRTQADRVRGLSGAFGFGRRILVPPDEIHVVVGDGRHTVLLSKRRRVFGQTAERPAYYWLNRLTQVIKLKTISFTVAIRGINDEGVEALDSSKVSFRLWAHAVAKLNPDKADIAAQRVGLDATSLINTITEVGTAELVASAATMSLQEIIAQRQKLAEIAFPQVNQILSELGYDLALLTITNLDGVAYRKLVEQAEARVSKETSIATNLEQVAELEDDQSRERNEAEIKAETEKKLAAERLEAQREVETATLAQQEAIRVRRHELQIKQVEREKVEADATHQTEMAKVQLGQQLGQAEVEKDAQLARVGAEREAELRAMQQKRNAEIRLLETEAEAERLAVEQARQIERDAERTQAEAKRLREEELRAAERAKEVALVEANQLAEAMRVDADGQARSLKIKADSESEAELVRAEAQATSTEKRAQAAKVRAEATRAEAAASGLAEAEVEEARVQVAEKQVAVTRAEGLAKAEIARAQADAEAERLQKLKDVEVNAKREMVSLYEASAALFELEKLRVQLEHEERLAQIQMEAHLKAFEAIAPSMRVHIYGSGGQVNQVMTDLLSLSQGLKHLGEEVPVVGRLLGDEGSDVSWGSSKLGQFVPYIKQVVAEVNPRMISSLKVTDLVDRLGPVIAGQEDLVTALTSLRQDARFRMVGNLPVAPLLKLVGINLPESTEPGDVAAAEAPIEAEPDVEPEAEPKPQPPEETEPTPEEDDVA